MRLQRLFRATASLLAAFMLAPVASIVPGAPFEIDSTYAAAPDGRLVVTWHHAAPESLATAGVERVNPSHANSRRSVVVARPGEAGRVAARLAQDPRVRSVVPDAIGHATEWPLDEEPDDDKYLAGYQQDLAVVGMPEAWKTTIGDPSVVVAVLDSGYNAAHGDLQGVPYVDPYNARTGALDIGGLTDVRGHGTHVAGTIAARTNNDRGIAGMAPGITLMPVTVLDDQGSGYWSDFLEGVDWARTHGADVVNLSLGGPLTASQVAAFQPTFDAAWAAGVLVVAAAGNNNNSNSFYPASMNHVISVAATDNDDVRASFSTYNAQVDVSAPGVLIMSAWTLGGYQAWSGTSMATPHVAALAALVKSVHPEFGVEELEAAVVSTARDIDVAGRDNRTGWGRIDAPKALAWTPPDVTPPAAAVSPAHASTNVVETVQPSVTFSEAVYGVGPSSVRLIDGAGNPVPATVSYDAAGLKATIAPLATLRSKSAYRIAVETGITDLAGNALAPATTGFTTGDTIQPTVSSTSPAAGATGISRAKTVRIVFSEPVKGISGATVRLVNTRTGSRVSAKVTYDAATRTAYLNPTSTMVGRTVYRLKLRAGITDLAGNALGPTSFTFKTRA